MSRRVYIPITDHNDGITCTSFYTVRFKPSSSGIWTTLNNVQPDEVGSPLAYSVLLQPLLDTTDYDYEIIRNCCEGNVSIAASGTFNSDD